LRGKLGPDPQRESVQKGFRERALGIEAMTFHETRSVGDPRKPDVRLGGKTVLIVEDNELNMKLFHDLLVAHGYATIQTRSGLEALDLARKHRPALILMDIQLPEVSGLEVTKWLKEDDELRAIPVVAITAFAMKGDEERIRSGGCEAYISKPISVSGFLETVHRFVGEPRG
jgi:two-component system cell cycle response regulator DivK